MPLVIPPGFASAAYVMDGPVGTPSFITTMGFDISAFSGDHENAADLAGELFSQHWLEFLSDELSFDRTILTIGNDGGLGSVVSSQGTGAGTGDFTAEAIAMAPILRKRTALLGRKGKGRMFMPGMLSNASIPANGEVPLQSRAIYDETAEEWMTAHGDALEQTSPASGPDPTGTAMPMVLLHSDATVPTPITSLSVAPKVGWIRHRLR